MEIPEAPTQAQIDNANNAKNMGFDTSKGGVTRYCVQNWNTVHLDRAKGSDAVLDDPDSGMKLQMYCDSAMKMAAAGLALASSIISFN